MDTKGFDSAIDNTCATGSNACAEVVRGREPRCYTAPKILSLEPLEAAAMVCKASNRDKTNPYGKIGACVVPGS